MSQNKQKKHVDSTLPRKKAANKKSKRIPNKPPLPIPKCKAEPSAPPLEELIQTMVLEPTAPPLELLEQPAAPTKKAKNKTTREINKILKKEDEKYVGLNFNVPPPEWTKEDRSKMREIMRTLSLTYKRQADKERMHQIGHEVRNSGPVEMALAREIIGLLQKDMNLLKNMQLKHLAFSTFSKRTYDWDEVSELMNHKKTPAECKEYWYMELYPQIKNMGFSPDNDRQLVELAIANKFQHWDRIAENIIGHTEYQCYVHFRRNLYKKMTCDQLNIKLK